MQLQLLVLDGQPLDASVFKPLKQYWHGACHRFLQRNFGKVITKYDFHPFHMRYETIP